MLVRGKGGIVYNVCSKYIGGRIEIPASKVINPEKLPTEQELANLRKLLEVNPKKSPRQTKPTLSVIV